MSLLELRDLSARYGPIKALHGLSLHVAEGEIVAVLGANGAGKTTTLRAISGLVRKNGEIAFAGRRISGWSPERVARNGIAHVPEGRGILKDLTVWENVRMGAYTRRNRTAIKQDFRRTLEYFPWLEERRNQQAGTLSGGEQQMLALARALVSRPRLLMLDEPSLGLAPLVVREIFRIVRAINRDEHVSVLLVEQNASLALDLADQAYLLETGRVAIAGPAADLRRDDAIRRSYLGY